MLINNKKLYVMALAIICSVATNAKTYFVATNGKDTNKGTKDAPFATLNKAQQMVNAGDTIYFREGTYRITPEQVMTPARQDGPKQYTYVFDLTKSGDKKKGHIVYAGYPGERPTFDFTDIKPQTRVSAFCLRGDYLHLRNFDIVGVQLAMDTKVNTQSECISAYGGSYCIVENLAMHHTQGIGFYLKAGHNNLVLNCDAYCNLDSLSGDKRGENNDGFGFHTKEVTDTCNVIRGCRAWWNADDGYDLINNVCPVTIENCWAFYNGFMPGTSTNAHDGNGFKAGGYAMRPAAQTKVPAVIPRNIIRNCIAYYNRASGFYSNHHLGGNIWEDNISVYNSANYNMTNRKSLEEVVDVPGYGHHLSNNISVSPRTNGRDFFMIDNTKSTNYGDMSYPLGFNFASIDMSTIPLLAPRKDDGSLPFNVDQLINEISSYMGF